MSIWNGRSADCERCAGLCCVALAFDRSEWFGFDKGADVACQYLSARDRCTIHGERTQRGFAGCAAFDCAGAGPRVSQELFGGRSWREQPELAPAMFEAFRTLRHVHELARLLELAARLELEPAREARRLELLERLEPEAGWSPQQLTALELGRVTAEVHAFLRTLRERLDGAPMPVRRLPIASAQGAPRSQVNEPPSANGATSAL